MKTFSIIYQFLQTLVGLAVLAFARLFVELSPCRRLSSCCWWFEQPTDSLNVCFGEIIICGRRSLAHELGHRKQSRMLGPLYLFVVGIPSVVRFIYRRLRGKDYAWYIAGYPESWAERLKPKVTFFINGDIVISER